MSSCHGLPQNSNPCRSGPSLPAALRRSLQLGGRPALLLRALMSRRAAGFAAAAGSAAGAEQRAAREAAEACGAQVVLGAPGTLARALGAGARGYRLGCAWRASLTFAWKHPLLSVALFACVRQCGFAEKCIWELVMYAVRIYDNPWH